MGCAATAVHVRADSTHERDNRWTPRGPKILHGRVRFPASRWARNHIHFNELALAQRSRSLEQHVPPEPPRHALASEVFLLKRKRQFNRGSSMLIDSAAARDLCPIRSGPYVCMLHGWVSTRKLVPRSIGGIVSPLLTVDPTTHESAEVEGRPNRAFGFQLAFHPDWMKSRKTSGRLVRKAGRGLTERLGRRGVLPQSGDREAEQVGHPLVLVRFGLKHDAQAYCLLQLPVQPRRPIRPAGS